jgi:predicted nucleic acid-binding protein
MKLFVDTWGWLTLYDRRESKHPRVDALYRDFRTQHGQLFTTDYVLDETFTLLFKRLPFSQAERALQILETAIQTGYLEQVWITQERFNQTKALRLKLQDKPTISFTDLSSMCVMEELGIPTILTGDAHFLHVGMGFQVVPQS